MAEIGATKGQKEAVKVGVLGVLGRAVRPFLCRASNMKLCFGAGGRTGWCLYGVKVGFILIRRK